MTEITASDLGAGVQCDPRSWSDEEIKEVVETILLNPEDHTVPLAEVEPIAFQIAKHADSYLLDLHAVEFGLAHSLSIEGGRGGPCTGGIKGGLPLVRLPHRTRHRRRHLFQLIWTIVYYDPSLNWNWQQAYEAALDGNRMFVEYRSIHRDPEIGSFISNNTMDHIAAVLCHEIAHAAHWLVRFEFQQAGVKKEPLGATNAPFARCRPHGPYWQRMYRYLRQEMGLIADPDTRRLINTSEVSNAYS